jgi:hypothetical protein
MTDTAQGNCQNCLFAWDYLDHKAISLPTLGHRFLGLRVFIGLHGVMWGDERLFETTINLAQFPKDQNQNNHDYEQQEWDVHLFISGSEDLALPTVH